MTCQYSHLNLSKLTHLYIYIYIYMWEKWQFTWMTILGEKHVALIWVVISMWELMQDVSHTYKYIFICVYIYICIFINIYIYMHIYIYIWCVGCVQCISVPRYEQGMNKSGMEKIEKETSVSRHQFQVNLKPLEHHSTIWCRGAWGGLSSIGLSLCREAWASQTANVILSNLVIQ